MKRLPPFAVVFGPTASGKSAFAKSLHERLRTGNHAAPASGVEIISADSMQVYRGMDIGTAKPSQAERTLIPHHLIDIRNPDQPFTAGDFVERAEEAILAAHGRGALPVVVGGTAFYVRCLLCGMPETPPSEPAVRGQLERELSAYGSSALRRELERVDPESARRIAPSDEYRLVRALEVYRLTGKPRSSFAVPTVPRENARDAVTVGLHWPRDALYRRINARVDAMARAGLREEVVSLLLNGYRPGDPGLRAIGYREYLEEFGENIDIKNGFDTRTVEALLPADEQVLPRIRRNTRRYAKRQLTFFRAFERTRWVNAEDPGQAVTMILDSFAGTPGG